MNVTFCFTKYCENEQLRIRRKNKAKTNPTCGEQAQRVEPSNPTRSELVEPLCNLSAGACPPFVWRV